MIHFSQRLNHAIAVAAMAHERQGQHRKVSGEPYIMHPYSVMLLASGSTDDEDVLIACLLHDIVEDVDPGIYSQDDIVRDFGDKVLRIILDVTKDNDEPDWTARAQKYIDHLRDHASDQAVIVSAADKTHNLLTIIYDHQHIGARVWGYLRENRDKQLWYFGAVNDAVQQRLPDLPVSRTLADTVARAHALS